MKISTEYWNDDGVTKIVEIFESFFPGEHLIEEVKIGYRGSSYTVVFKRFNVLFPEPLNINFRVRYTKRVEVYIPKITIIFIGETLEDTLKRFIIHRINLVLENLDSLKYRLERRK